MLKNNDIQEMFLTTVSILPITSDTKEVDELVKRAIGCIKILKDSGEVNSFITTNDNNQDLQNIGKTPLDIVILFNSRNEKSINNLQLRKLEQYLTNIGGKRNIDLICNALKNDLKKVREQYTRYSEVAFEIMNKAQKIIPKNSNSSVLEFNEFLSTVEEKIRSCDNLLIEFMKEIDSDIQSLLNRDTLLMNDESIAPASLIEKKHLY